MPDQTLTCVDCQQQFLFTEGEQTFFTSKGFSAPRRCKPCRDIKKAQRGDQAQTQTQGSPQQPVDGNRRPATLAVDGNRRPAAPADNTYRERRPRRRRGGGGGGGDEE